MNRGFRSAAERNDAALGGDDRIPEHGLPCKAILSRAAERPGQLLNRVFRSAAERNDGALGGV